MPRVTRTPWPVVPGPLVAWPLVAGSVLLGLTGCQRSVSPRECEQLLERYTDKQIDQTRPSTPPHERERLIGEAKKLAAADPAFFECTSRVSRAQLECALEAGTADAIERCLL